MPAHRNGAPKAARQSRDRYGARRVDSALCSSENRQEGPFGRLLIAWLLEECFWGKLETAHNCEHSSKQSSHRVSRRSQLSRQKILASLSLLPCCREHLPFSG